MRAIIVKELREHLRWLPIGMVVLAAAAWMVTPIQMRNYVPPMTLVTTFGFASALFALFLGGVQSAPDFRDQQRGYLFHRAVSRNRIVVGKILAGAILYAIACSIPLVCVALWFAVMGVEYLPVRPAQVIPAVLMCGVCFILHPAILLTFQREASWFGTKLFPLFAALASLVLFVGWLVDPVSLGGLVALLLCLLLLIAVLLAVLDQRWAGNVALLAGSLCVSLVGLYIAAMTIEALNVEKRAAAGVNLQFQYGVDAEGNLWAYRYRQVLKDSGYTYENVLVSGDKIVADAKPNLQGELPVDFKPTPLSYWMKTNGGSRLFPTIENRSTLPTKRMYYDSRGLVLVYDNDPLAMPPLIGVVSKSGFHQAGTATGPGFDCDAPLYGQRLTGGLAEAGYATLWADRRGIYQFDSLSGSITTLLEMPIEAGTCVRATPHAPPQLLILSDGRYQLFGFHSEEGDDRWLEQLDASLGYRYRPLPKLSLQPVASYPALPQFGIAFSIGIAEGGKLFAVDQHASRFATVEPSATRWDVAAFDSPLVTRLTAGDMAIATIIPGGVYMTIGGLAVAYNLAQDMPPTSSLPLGGLSTAFLTVVIPTIGLLAVLAALLTTYLCRRRDLSPVATWLWSLFGFLFAAAAPLAVVAIYPKVLREACPRCEKPRRVDRRLCEACQAEWDAPASDGIELFEIDAMPAQAETAEV